MRKLTLLLTLLFLLIINLEPVHAYQSSYHWDRDWKIYVSDYYGTDYYLETLLARNSWNSALDSINSSIDINMGSSSDYDVMLISADYGYTTWTATAFPEYEGNTFIIGGGSMRVNDYWHDTYTFERSRAIICHEIGHMLGQYHNVTIPKSLMYKSSSVFYELYGIMEPNDFDINELATIY